MIPEEYKQKIIEMHKAGEEIDKIVSLLYISESTARRTLKAAGFKVTDMVAKCRVCGKEFSQYTRNHVICRDCKKAETAKKQRYCKTCGKVLVTRPGYNSKYCSTACKKEDQEIIEYEKPITEKYQPTSNNELIIKRNKAAREHGMTYGQYVAAMKDGKI